SQRGTFLYGMGAEAKNLKDVSFGLLVVRGAGEPQGARRRAMWVVRCACGTEKSVRADHLLSDKIRSCGCATARFKKAKLEKKYNLTNEHFGRLWVISRAKSEKQGGSSHATWQCKCECGQIVVVAARSLRSGATQSCGCLHSEMMSSSIEMGASQNA